MIEKVFRIRQRSTENCGYVTPNKLKLFKINDEFD